MVYLGCSQERPRERKLEGSKERAELPPTGVKVSVRPKSGNTLVCVSRSILRDALTHRDSVRLGRTRALILIPPLRLRKEKMHPAEELFFIDQRLAVLADLDNLDLPEATNLRQRRNEILGARRDRIIGPVFPKDADNSNFYDSESFGPAS
jgi:hypothetical protein